ncbi:MAG TPA: pentapeptide repeat-containing protein [Pyrinomonadaceae bacterium]|nr:pentapeptide repeat-containing protein [Pyrinomonadaceae bacterium]
MANSEQLEILQQGAEIWNEWRRENPGIKPDLRKAELRHAKLEGVNLSNADLWEAQLYKANLDGADLRHADLRGAHLGSASIKHGDLTDAMISQAYLGSSHFDGSILTRALLGSSNLMEASLVGSTLIETSLAQAGLFCAKLTNANLSKANFVGASLQRADLSGANLTNASLAGADLKYASLARADLSGALLIGTSLVQTNVEGATITGCRIYGISVWGLIGEPRAQTNLVITDLTEPLITVDDIEVAQFVYLMLNNKKIRRVIDTITSKLVLILGRFTADRKQVLEAIREQLRRRNYLPVLFDFDKPLSRDITETVSTLAHMARFVIADLTDAKSIPQELERIVPNLPSLAIQPILLKSEAEYGMFEHFKKYPWVLATYFYSDVEDLLENLDRKVINQAETKARELL